MIPQETDSVLSISANELPILKRLAEVIIWAEDDTADLDQLPLPPTNEEYKELVLLAKRIMQL